jgi:protein tyrosine phosphatase (PTP) superfamily phosphohydrolase (DUF442 family)
MNQHTTGVWPAAGLVPATWLGALAGRTLWTLLATRRSHPTPVAKLDQVDVMSVDERLWRGPAPTDYAAMHRAGVRLVVDLRAEADTLETARAAEANGLDVMILPIANGCAPAEHDLERFRDRHGRHRGITYVHCQAGEGRTGALVGAYQVRSGRSAIGAITDALAIGSLTFAQMAFIATGGTRPLPVWLLDQTIDRPTERIFDLIR